MFVHVLYVIDLFLNSVAQEVMLEFQNEKMVKMMETTYIYIHALLTITAYSKYFGDAIVFCEYISSPERVLQRGSPYLPADLASYG